jgi:TolB-like protein
VAALLFEMLTGKPAFQGRTVMEVFHATLYEEPPVLGGSAAAATLDKVVRRGLAKRPEDRPPSASVMARELREAFLGQETGPADRVVAMTRLIVLPFRVLRPDPESDFLRFSLPDAISTSLCGLTAVIVRSSLAAARFADEVPDLKRVVAEADVDVALTGTLLRAGDEIRVSAQLVEAPGGAVVWTHTSQVTLRDIFQLQDMLVGRILDGLALHLTAREHKLLRHDVPRSPAAYEFYLRGNALIEGIGLNRSGSFAVARDLYLRCLEQDGSYAPAWARLGRCYRVLGKAGEEPQANLPKAESCVKRALDLNPGLAAAHKLYAQIETELGRAPDAVTRLLGHARPDCADPEVFTGLVHACRYGGLLDASIEAHLRARRLDRRIATSVGHTYWLAGDLARAHEEAGAPSFYFNALVFASMGRRDEAVSVLREREAEPLPAAMRAFLASLRALLEGRHEESLEATERSLVYMRADAEARYYLARQLAQLGARERALEEMNGVVELGFFCPQAFARDRWLDPVRNAREFAGIVERAERGRQGAAAAFTSAGGERLLGLRLDSHTPSP